MKDNVPLGGGTEFDLIRRLESRWGDLARGIGDDAALLRVPRGEQLVASTDVAIDTVHFRREWLSMRDVGNRAVTAALSDLAAMAAWPLGVLISLELTDDARQQIDALADGVGDAARSAKTVIVGGNVARADTLAISTTVLGAAFAPVKRSGARPGDFLYVTGQLGGPRVAVSALEKGKRPAADTLQRFTHPKARLAESRWLAARGMIAAIDVSDGLAADAGHLAAASDVALEIDVERVPLASGASPDDALASGEEYELLLAARTPLPDAEFVAEFGIALTLIGRVAPGGPDVRVMKDGKRVATPRGYDHFSR